MDARLKGINRKRVRRRNGTIIIYRYAWKGGPRLEGEPGTPEFLASYVAAIESRRKPKAGVLLSLLAGYQATTEWRDLADRTRRDKIGHIKLIEAEFGDFPLAALDDRRTRGEFLAWRDRLAARSRRQADYVWTTLARVFSWAQDRGLITTNPCAKSGRLYRGNRRDKIWHDDDEAAYMRSAPEHLRLPVLMALWTGQRQGDLLRLTWAAYDGRYIRLRQSKTGARVTVPVGAPLKAALDAAVRKSPSILVTMDGTPWTADGFRSSFNKARKAAGVEGVTFNDLRGSAVTRLALSGCTEAEIATITGHTLREVRSILDSNYLHRDVALAESAIAKLEKRTKTPERSPERS